MQVTDGGAAMSASHFGVPGRMIPPARDFHSPNFRELKLGQYLVLLACKGLMASG